MYIIKKNIMIAVGKQKTFILQSFKFDKYQIICLHRTITDCIFDAVLDCIQIIFKTNCKK